MQMTEQGSELDLERTFTSSFAPLLPSLLAVSLQTPPLQSVQPGVPCLAKACLSIRAAQYNSALDIIVFAVEVEAERGISRSRGWC